VSLIDVSVRHTRRRDVTNPTFTTPKFIGGQADLDYDEDIGELEMEINDGGMSYEDEDYVAWVVEEAMKQMTPWQGHIFSLHLGGIELNLIAEMAGVTRQAIGNEWRKALACCRRVSTICLSGM